MVKTSRGLPLFFALLIGAVVVLLPRPEGILFEISGDASQSLFKDVQRDFERVEGETSSPTAYIVRAKATGTDHGTAKFLEEKTRLLNLPDVEIRYIDGLSPNAHRFLAILAVLIPLFIFEPIPLQIIAIFIGVLLVGMNVADAKIAWAPYMHPVVVFIMSCLIFSIAVDKAGLTRRLGYFIIRRAGTDMVRFTFVLAIGLGIISTFIHDAAACAVGIVTMQPLMRAVRIQPHSNSAKFMMLSIPFATSCGGMGSLIGGGRCMVSAAFLKEFTGTEITFFEWIKFAGPAALITVPIAVFIVYLVFKPEAKITLPEFDESLGPWTPIEKKTLIISLITLIFWITNGLHHIDYSVTGMIGVSALILFDVLTWEDIHTNLEWGTSLFIFGGGISLGLAMGYSGAANYVAMLIYPLIREGGWLLLFIVVSVLGALATNAMVNVAAVAIILPVAFILAKMEGIDPRVITLCLGTASSFAMLMVIGNPSNAIAYSFRYFKPSDLAKVGLVATPVLLGVLLLVAAVWWRFLGLL